MNHLKLIREATGIPSLIRRRRILDYMRAWLGPLEHLPRAEFLASARTAAQLEAIPHRRA